jgi:hypothetical protein
MLTVHYMQSPLHPSSQSKFSVKSSHLDADDGAQPLPHVVARQAGVALLEQLRGYVMRERADSRQPSRPGAAALASIALEPAAPALNARTPTPPQHTLFFFASALTSRVSAARSPSMWLPPSTVLMEFAKPTVTSEKASAHHCRAAPTSTPSEEVTNEMGAWRACLSRLSLWGGGGGEVV